MGRELLEVILMEMMITSINASIAFKTLNQKRLGSKRFEYNHECQSMILLSCNELKISFTLQLNCLNTAGYDKNCIKNEPHNCLSCNLALFKPHTNHSLKDEMSDFPNTWFVCSFFSAKLAFWFSVIMHPKFFWPINTW